MSEADQPTEVSCGQEDPGKTVETCDEIPVEQAQVSEAAETKNEPEALPGEAAEPLEQV